MITLFPGFNFPREVGALIFLQITGSLEVLKVYQQVSKGFKEAVDDPAFLHSLLVKFKGPGFLDSIYTSAPKKFLLIDRDMTFAFQRVVSETEYSTVLQKHVLKNTASVALKCLSMRLFSISGRPDYYFRMPKDLLEGLEKVDVMDQKAWQKCIMSMVMCLTTHNIPIQILISCLKQNPFLQKIESSFKKPNEKMQKLINDFEITDIFFANPRDLVINANKKGLLVEHLQEAVLDPDDYKFASMVQQLHSVLQQTRLQVVDGQLTYLVDRSKCKELCEKLKTFEVEKLKTLELAFAPEEQYLMGLFFSEVWPNIHKKFGETESAELTYRLLITSFKKSFQMAKIEGSENGLHLNCDIPLKNFILHMLQDNTTGMKKFIEDNYSGQMLEFFQSVIFREVWNDSPYDYAQTYYISKKQNSG